MNCKDFRFCILILIFAITKETQGNDSRSNLFPDKDYIDKTFNNLLDTLVRVNQERVDALKKFFNLDDFRGAKKLLRSSGEEGPLISLFVIKDVDPVTGEISIKRSKKKSYSDSEDSDSDSDSDSSSDDSSSDDKTQARFNNRNLRMHKVNPKLEKLSDSSHEVVSSENSRNFTHEVLSASSNEQTGNKLAGRYSYYSCGSHAYTSCQRACKEAYRNACTYYYMCSSHLYRYLRSECKYSCASRFYYYRQ